MPRVSAFFGIVIFLYHDERTHAGRPHFHAVYAADEASLDLETLDVVAGSLPRRQLTLVRKWAAVHRTELRDNWERARRDEASDPSPHSSTADGSACRQFASYHAGMRTTPRLIDVTLLASYNIRLAYEDGTVGDVDLSYLTNRGPVFHPLRDPTYFAMFRLDPEANTIVWPNEADIAPETLYALTQQSDRGTTGIAL